MGHAAQFAEGYDVGDEDNYEEKRLARNQEQHAQAEKGGHEQINENRQSKLHKWIVTVSGAKARRLLNTPKPAVPTGVFLQSGVELRFAKIRPEGLSDDEFGVGDLPKQKIAHAHLAACAD